MSCLLKIVESAGVWHAYAFSDGSKKKKCRGAESSAKETAKGKKEAVGMGRF
jgi:hypothetical protein